MADVNNDGFPDMVIVGDWMPIKYLLMKMGSLKMNLKAMAYRIQKDGGIQLSRKI